MSNNKASISMTSLDWFIHATKCKTIKDKKMALEFAKEFQKREILQFIKYGQTHPNAEIDDIINELYKKIYVKEK
jgi:hypothetical protein